MKFRPVEPPRTFRPAGPDGPEIAHVATLELDVDEQVTVVTPDGREVDVVRKEWGLYPLPSLNSRLARFGFHPVLAMNAAGSLYLLLVEDGKRREFEAYLASEKMTIVGWLCNKLPA